MQINNNIENDIFAKSVKKQIETCEIQPEENLWEQIDVRLQKKARRTRLYAWASIAGAGVAALIALIFILQMPQNGDELNVAQQQAVENPSSVEIPEVSEKTTDPEKFIAEVKQVEKKVVSKKKISEKAVIFTQNENETSVQPFDTLSVSVIEEDLIAETAPEQEKEEKASGKKPKEDIQLPRSELDEIFWAERNLSDKSEEWTLALNFSSGNQNSETGNFAEHLSAGNDWYGNDDISSSPNYPGTGTSGPNNPVSEDKYDTKKYLPPLSFGFSLRKNISKRISIGSGLVYTYLQTELSNSHNKAISSKSKLHYLGVPLNLSLNLWENDNWNIYYSIGGMVEKGLRGEISEKTNNVSVESSGDISGFQWSAQTSIGATYKFAPKFGIFIEPKGVYYFDNNQPVSIRTDKQFLFELFTGLRYSF